MAYFGRHRKKAEKPMHVVATVRSAEHSNNTSTLRMTKAEYDQAVEEVLDQLPLDERIRNGV